MIRGALISFISTLAIKADDMNILVAYTKLIMRIINLHMHATCKCDMRSLNCHKKRGGMVELLLASKVVGSFLIPRPKIELCNTRPPPRENK